MVGTEPGDCNYLRTGTNNRLERQRNERPEKWGKENLSVLALKPKKEKHCIGFCREVSYDVNFSSSIRGGMSIDLGIGAHRKLWKRVKGQEEI